MDRQSKAAFIFIALLVLQLACGSDDNAHTTATTIVPPPPRQEITVVPVPVTHVSSNAQQPANRRSSSMPSPVRDEHVGVNPNGPLLVFNLPNGKSFRLGDVVAVDFSVQNAKLRADGGDFRVRYIVDDEDPKWIDSAEPFGLAGWVAGKHTIRLELIGPDGWPYRNGNQNIVTREISVSEK